MNTCRSLFPADEEGIGRILPSFLPSWLCIMRYKAPVMPGMNLAFNGDAIFKRVEILEPQRESRSSDEGTRNCELIRRVIKDS